MTATRLSFTELSDDQLLAEVTRLAATERRATAALIRSLMELDARRLYLGEGCSSLFTFCTQVLHLSESAAYNRIEASRAARRFPSIVEALEEGSLTLTAVRLLAPHLTPDNYQNLLASARHRTKADIERLVSTVNPKPAVPSTIRKLPVPRPVLLDPNRVAPVPAPLEHHHTMPAPSMTSPPPRTVVAPLEPDRYRVQVTISRETHEKLRQLQALMRHAIPNGDVAEIFDRALTVLLQEVQRRRSAATSSPRKPDQAAPASRHIPAAVKREVWRRDEGQCAFIGRRGRCTERAFLEYHHVQPYAAGGMATASNIELRCRAHNLHEASLFSGGAGGELMRGPGAQDSAST